MDLFLKRHPEISVRNTEVISKARAAVTEEMIHSWFSLLRNHLEEENVTDILKQPSRMYNLDEIGIPMCPKIGKILGQKGEKNQYRIASGPEKGNITVLCTYSADGQWIEPMIIYDYKRIPRAIATSVPEDFAIGRSDSGWITSATFFEYIANVFYKRLVEKRIQFPILLLFDGHKSHINLQLHEFCVEKQIILFCLPPNATHIIQPCDVGIFKPLKDSWKKIVRSHISSTTAYITKLNFAQLFENAFKSSMKSDTIKNAFLACGLYPFNPDRIDYV